MINGLPVYQIEIDESEEGQSEVDFIALVDKPAIQRNFMAFKDQKPMAFQVVSTDQRIVSGPFMIADLPIYRNFNGEECYVIFSKETILKTVKKFFKKGFQHNINIMHDGNQVVSNAIIFESFICDHKRGIAPMKGYEDVKDGSWFGSMFIEDQAAWNKIISSDLRGFSIEGIFNMKPAGLSEDERTMGLINELLKNCVEE